MKLLLNLKDLEKKKIFKAEVAHHAVAKTNHEKTEPSIWQPAEYGLN